MPGKGFDVPDVSALSTGKIRELVHELHVHQIELEMQNEELSMAPLTPGIERQVSGFL